MHSVETLEGAKEERAGSNGRVQQSDSGEGLCCFPIRVKESALGFGITAAQTDCQKRTHPGIQQPGYHRCRRVEGSGHMPEVRRHHTFEDASEHVRSHATARGVFSHSKMETLEQPVERHTPEIIGDVRLESAFQGMRLEQASVQEGDLTKRGGSATPT